MSERQKYRHFFRCRQCGDRFHVDRLTADPAKVNPRCPKKACKGKARQSHMADVGMDVAAGKAPAQVGAISVRARDMAYDMVTKDQGLTDIQDHTRPGESTAPKLPWHLQKKVDGFWGQNNAKPQGPKTMRADLSPIFGERATQGLPAAQFKAESGSLVEPILKHKPTGSSAVPDYIPVAG